MALIPESFAPVPFDPNAPKVLDLDQAKKMVSAAPKYGRLPTGDIIVKMGEQLGCALAELQKGSSSVNDAQNEAVRYRKEAENANREVAAMTTQLALVREERDGLKAKVAALESEVAVLKAPKKRGPKAKVVQMDHPEERRAAQ